MKKSNLARITLLTAFTAGVLVSCTDEQKEIDKEQSSDNKKANAAIFTKSQSLNATLNGKVFSIPSPFETAILIKEKGGDFDGSILNSPEKVDTYANATDKALVMGVYGADLGYATIYDQSQQSIKYIKSVETLSKDLGISGAFDKVLIERFMENGNNQDSLLKFVSIAYRNGDKFLKENKREDVAVKILAGGWIESIYFATQVASKSGNPEIKQRIAEQKPTLKNLVAVYKDVDAESPLYAKLIELNGIFKGVKLETSEVTVVDDAAKKTSTFQFDSKANMADSTFASITQKITEIRNTITQ